MGKKSAPQPFIQPTAIAPDIVDREDLDRRSTKRIEMAKKSRSSVIDGVESPQASLLAERDYWDKKESLLKG